MEENNKEKKNEEKKNKKMERKIRLYFAKEKATDFCNALKNSFSSDLVIFSLTAFFSILIPVLPKWKFFQDKLESPFYITAYNIEQKRISQLSRRC